MITIRKSSDRGHADYGWLNTYHTFSFGRYFDPKFPGFGPLRVINEDRVTPGQGFGEHPHADMEIISYVLSGKLAHTDSLGHTQTLSPGEVQRMSAGAGIEHAEFNPSRTEPVHFLQIWITPAKRGVNPAYGQKMFPIHEQHNTLHQIASPDGADGSLEIQQDARVFAGMLDAGTSIERTIAPGRQAWLQVARGSLSVNGTPLAQGDGAAITDERTLSIKASENAEIIYFDLP
jgi:redox-sensitive bicupin YhaK (pirin superfamily)